MLRIVIESRDGIHMIRAEGQMIGPWVNELRWLCERVARGGGEPVVDLARVSFVDRDGVDLLRTLSSRGVAIVSCSGFVAEQLKG